VAGVVGGGGLGPSASTQIKNLLDQLDQIVDAKIVDGVFKRRKQAEIASEPEDIPVLVRGA
jgi:hypothetical protein